SVYKYRGQPAWAALRSEGAELMVTTGDAVDQAGQGVLFYLYSRDLAALRRQLLGAGIDPRESEERTPGPRGGVELRDPDRDGPEVGRRAPEGEVLKAARTAPEEPG